MDIIQTVVVVEIAMAIIIMKPILYLEFHYPFGAEGVYLRPANLLNKSPTPTMPITCSAGFVAVEAARLQDQTANGVK